tara:strand:+ start:188 stop:367 length:180 start_codon:yes stop_codon:yes gene_type:complete
MAQNHIVDWIGVVLALLFAVTMFWQGHAIFHGKYGYKHTEREKNKMIKARKQVEDLFKK